MSGIAVTSTHRFQLHLFFVILFLGNCIEDTISSVGACGLSTSSCSIEEQVKDIPLAHKDDEDIHPLKHVDDVCHIPG